MMKSDKELHLEKRLEDYYDYLLRNFDRKAKRARIENYARQSYVNSVLLAFQMSYLKGTPSRMVAEQFDHKFNMGEELQSVYSSLPEVVHAFCDLEEANESWLPHFFSESKDDQAKAFDKCVHVFIRYKGLRFFISHIHDNYPQLIKKDAEGNSVGASSTKTSNLPSAGVKRSKNDGATDLKLDETIALIKLLKENRWILRDEYLTNEKAAYAFHLLTGYSKNTIRQELSNPAQSPKTLAELHEKVQLFERKLKKMLS